MSHHSSYCLEEMQHLCVLLRHDLFGTKCVIHGLAGLQALGAVADAVAEVGTLIVRQGVRCPVGNDLSSGGQHVK
jgi:hypothetical protein